MKHYGSYTVIVEGKNEKEVQDKMQHLYEQLSKIEEKCGIEGFTDTEEYWAD